MRYKAKVLRRFPDARPVVDMWPSGSPRRVVIEVTHPEVDRKVIIGITDDGVQGYTAAWRSAYYWCVRNPESAA